MQGGTTQLRPCPTGQGRFFVKVPPFGKEINRSGTAPSASA